MTNEQATFLDLVEKAVTLGVDVDEIKHVFPTKAPVQAWIDRESYPSHENCLLSIPILEEIIYNHIDGVICIRGYI